MPLGAQDPGRPLAVAEVLEQAFRIFGASLLRCLPYGVLALMAGQLQSIYEILTRQPLGEFGGGDPLWWVLFAVGTVLGFGFLNVILLEQKALMASRPPARGPFAEGFARAPAAAGAFIIVLLALGACLLPVLAVPQSLLSIRLAALLVLALPAGYLGVALSCVWPALLLDRLSIGQSLRKSVQLVSGNWWHTNAVYLVATALLAVLFIAAGIIIGLLMAAISGGDTAVATTVATVIVAVLGALYVPFLTAVVLVLYRDLKARQTAG